MPYNPMDQILHGMMTGASIGQMIQRQAMQKKEMQRQEQQDKLRAELQSADFDMEALRRGLRPLSSADEVELQTGIRQIDGEFTPGMAGVPRMEKSDLRAIKNPVSGARYVYSESDALKKRMAEAKMMDDLTLDRLRKQGDIQVDTQKRKNDLVPMVDIQDPNTGQVVRVPAGYADDAARGFSTIFQSRTPKPAPLRFLQSTNDRGDVTVLGVDQSSGRIVTQERAAGAGKAARGRSGGGAASSIMDRMMFRAEQDQQKADRKSGEESMRNLREQAEALQGKIDQLGKEKDTPPRGYTSQDWRAYKLEQQKVLIKRKNDLYQQEAAIKSRIFGDPAALAPAPPAASAGTAPARKRLPDDEAAGVRAGVR